MDIHRYRFTCVRSNSKFVTYFCKGKYTEHRFIIIPNSKNPGNILFIVESWCLPFVYARRFLLTFLTSCNILSLQKTEEVDSESSKVSELLHISFSINFFKYLSLLIELEIYYQGIIFTIIIILI